MMKGIDSSCLGMTKYEFLDTEVFVCHPEDTRDLNDVRKRFLVPRNDKIRVLRYLSLFCHPEDTRDLKC